MYLLGGIACSLICIFVLRMFVDVPWFLAAAVGIACGAVSAVVEERMRGRG